MGCFPIIFIGNIKEYSIDLSSSMSQGSGLWVSFDIGTSLKVLPTGNTHDQLSLDIQNTVLEGYTEVIMEKLHSN